METYEMTDVSGVKILMDYYPHKRLVFRVPKIGRIVVNKPYGLVTGSARDMTTASPCIQLDRKSMHSLNLTFNDLTLMMRAIDMAIDLLNAEGDGLVIDKNFVLSNTIKYSEIPSNVRDIHQYLGTNKRNSIPYKYIQSNSVYEDDKGHKWIYLGKGWLCKDAADDGYYLELVDKCKSTEQQYVYINVDKLETCTFSVNRYMIVCDRMPPDVIGLCATKKRFIREVAEISSMNIYAIIDRAGTGRYTFVTSLKNKRIIQ